MLRLEPLEPRVLLSSTGATVALFDASPAVFVENQGQWGDALVRYAFQGSGANVLFTDAGPVFQLFQSVEPASETLAATNATQFSVTFECANAVSPVGQDASRAAYNYYVGDQANWRSGVPTFQTVAYPGLWCGIDLLTWGRRDGLKYEFHVAPGADPGQIRLHYEGIEGLSLDASGALHIATALGGVVDDAPILYQEVGGQRVEVAGAFQLLDATTYGFSIAGPYDPQAELVIDPALQWSSFLGGTDWDDGWAITLDASGNPIVGGHTFSAGFATVGAYDTTGNGGGDAFVAKVSADGSGVLWATYLGGTAIDWGLAIARDGSGNLLFTGYTTSTGFPTPGGFDTTANGGQDAFVAKLSGDGASLLWASYLGGAANEQGAAIAVDASGDAFVTGFTLSSDFPTPNGFDPSHGGLEDGFVAKFKADGTSLLWSSYLGGADSDWGKGIALDGLGNAFVVGQTKSADFPASGGFDLTLGGSNDAMVAKVSSAGALLWSSYLGGAGYDEGLAIAVETSTGNVRVTGYTGSTSFPVFGGFDSTHNGGQDVFIVNMSPGGGGLLWSSFLGGSGDDYGKRLALDAAGNAFITGHTYSTNFPTPGGFDTTSNGSCDALVAKVSADGATLLWASYLGGSSPDYGTDIAVDATGSAFFTGYTYSSNFPTPGGFDTTYVSPEAIVARVYEPPTIDSLSDAPDPVTRPAALTLTANGVADTNGTVVIVEFYRDANGNGTLEPATDVLLGNDTSGADGWAWSGATLGWPGGPQTYLARAQDNDGFWSGTAATTGTVTNATPTVASLADGPDPVTRPEALTLTASGVSDADGTLAQVEFYRDANGNGTLEPGSDALLGADANGADGWSWAGGTSGWPAGPQTYLARAQDNDGAWSAPVSTTGTVENALPGLSGLTAAPDPVARPDPLNLTATGATDPDGLIALVEFYRDADGNGVLEPGTDVLLGTDTDLSEGWTWSGPTSGFPSGTHGYLARAQDDDGGWSGHVSTTGTVTNAPPTLDSVAVLAGGAEDADFAITYMVLAAAADEADANSDPLSFRIESVSSGTLTKGGVPVVPGTTLLAAGESLVWHPDPEASGTLQAFTVKAWDGEAASAAAVPVSVDVASVNDPPAFQGALPADPSVRLVGQGFAFDFDATDVEQVSLTYSLVAGPAWLNMDAATGLLSGTPNRRAHIGSSPVTVRVADGLGGSDDHTFQLTVQGQVIALGAALPVPLTKTTFTDASGDLVSASAKGLGTFYLVRGVASGAGNNTPGDLVAIEIEGSDAKSSLAISAKAAVKGVVAATSVRDIVVNGSLGSLSAALMGLAGDLTMSGSVAKLTLGDVAAQHQISIGANPLIASATVVLGRVHDASLTSGTPLKSLSVVEWLDTDATPDVLSAPWISSLVTRGSKVVGGPKGDFEASMSLSGVGATKGTLGKVAIAGSVVGGSWAITGTAGSVAVRGAWTNGSFQSNVLKSLAVTGLITEDNTDGDTDLIRVLTGGYSASDLTWKGYIPPDHLFGTLRAYVG